MHEDYPAFGPVTHRETSQVRRIIRAPTGYQPDVLMPASPTVAPGIDRVGIVLPARDEAGRVVDAIIAIGEAARAVLPEITVVVMVVDHGSTDGTGAIASGALAELSEIGVTTRLMSATRGGVGTARHVGIVAMTEHWRRPERAWVLSTDADSRVRPDWIVRYVRHAEAGALAVAGVVDLFDDGESSDFRDRWRSDYGASMCSDGTHPHAHAANLGVRLDAYRCSGGFRDVGPADDRDLWQRLCVGGVEPVADSTIVVDTSGRRTGRVPSGFAAALSTLYPLDRDLDRDPGDRVGFAAGAAG
jgi:hypothetical protein